MTIDKENFMQSIKRKIDNFLREHLDGYTAYGYDRVREISQAINDDKIDNKPIYHISLAGEPSQGARQPVSDGKEGRKVFFSFAIYTIIRNDYKEKQDRSFVLDGIVDELKHIFDSEGDNLEFNQVNLTPFTTDLMGENADGLYAVECTLDFWVMKVL